MKHYLPPLDSLKAFESAARHLSFSQAADELCISKGAVSYQIKKLEEHIQCRLFKRSVRQVYLTEAGQALLQTTKNLFLELDDTLQSMQGDNRQAGVTIAVSTYVATRWLSPRISVFNESNPEIPVRFLHSVNSEDFKLTDVDMAIQWQSLKRKPSKNHFDQIPMHLSPAVAPQLIDNLGLGNNVSLEARALLEGPLSAVPLLCEDRHLDLWDEWLAVAFPESSESLPNPKRVISDANVRAQAAIDGQGFVLADALMNNEIDNGLLIKPFCTYLDGYGYALLSSQSRLSSDQAIILKEWFSATH